MMAEATTTEAQESAPVTEPSKPKPPRKRHVQIDVPPWQQDWPLEAQLKCYHQRQELKTAQEVIRRQNQLIRHLRHECRLFQRVMRLKHEAKIEGLSQGIDRALAQHPDNGARQELLGTLEIDRALAQHPDNGARQELLGTLEARAQQEP